LWESANLWIGIPTTLLAALTGITSITDTAGASTLFGLGAGVLTPLLAFTVAAMSGLATFLDPNKQSTKHYHVASEYQALVNDIRLFCEVECVKERHTDKLEDSLRSFNARLNKLNNEPVIISKRTKRIVEAEIKAGKHRYQIDTQVQQLSVK
jgi:hypothetical protein